MSLVRPKIVLAGGTGFVGKYLSQQFTLLHYEVVIISRQADCISWDDTDSILRAVDGAELLINLAGKSVNCRYTKANKEAILLSRTETTRKLGEAVMNCNTPPSLWVNSSTATIYRHAEDHPMTEDGGEIGKGFSVSVAKAWEEKFFSFNRPGVRQCALRIAIVLGKGGGVVPPISNLVRLGLGGKQGSGKQKFSWIHISDLYRIITFLQKNNEIHGVVNCSSPAPVSNAMLMKAFRRAQHVHIGLPMPKWMLEMGSALIQTETELLLKSRWVLPDRLLKAGFTFEYPSLEQALAEIFKPEK